MIDSARLESGLIHVARRYAPALIPAGWQKPGDFPGPPSALAGALASYNVLVMAGEAAQVSAPSAVKGWTDGYLDFYRLLCAELFPSYTRVTAFYVDQAQPLFVAVYGEATPVITGMAGLVTPYVVARQGTRPLEVEVLGMMDMILEELEATDLPRDEYRHLRDDGAAMLRQLLQSSVRQLPLTPPARPIFEDMVAQHPAPSVAPVAASSAAPEQTAKQARPALSAAPPPMPADLPEPPPMPPDTMPEEIQAPPAQTPEAPSVPSPRTFDPEAVPIFFNPGRGGNVPPVPPLPPRGG
jgi:hypothetical protein